VLGTQVAVALAYESRRARASSICAWAATNACTKRSSSSTHPTSARCSTIASSSWKFSVIRRSTASTGTPVAATRLARA